MADMMDIYETLAIKKTRRKSEDKGICDIGAIAKRVISNLKVCLDDEESLLNDTAAIIEYITFSTSRNLFIKHRTCDKIYRYSKSDVKMYHNIGSGTIMAAYTALTKKICFTRSCIVDRRFPLGTGSSLKSHETDYPIMSIPITTSDETLIAVIDVYRESGVQHYDQNDALIAMCISNWLGAVIMKHRESVLVLSLKNLNDEFMKIMGPFFSVCSKTQYDVIKLVYLMCFTIKKHFNSEKVVFYKMHDIEKYIADLYEDTSKNQMPKKIDLTNNQLVKDAIRKKGIFNLCEMDLKKSKEHSEIRNILSMTIEVQHNVGIIQLINKTKGDFTKKDEMGIELLKYYFGMIMQFQTALSQSEKLKRRMRDTKGLMLHQMEPCDHDLKTFRSLWDHDLKPPIDFFSFNYYPKDTSKIKLTEMALLILRHTLSSFFHMSNDIIMFVSVVSNGYRDNSYHNYEHAIIVSHCMMNMILENKELFSENEKVSLMIASLCHDIDHPGFTNSFLKATSNDLVQLYQESVLENHHSYMALQFIKHCKMFSYMPNKDYKILLSDIHELILSTDLSIYLRKISTITNKVVGEHFTLNDEHDKLLIKGIMMTACDISGQFKPLTVSLKVTKQLYVEFYNQGDEEKKRGLIPISMMDRNKAYQQPQDQIAFLSFICIPCLDVLQHYLPCTQILIQNCNEVLTYWKGVEKDSLKRNKLANDNT